MISEGVGYESWAMGYKSYIYDQLALKPLKLALDYITQEGKAEFCQIRFHSLTPLAYSL